MSTYDNAPPLDGWSVQPGRHCGEFCWDKACGICGEYVLPPTIELGSE